MTSDDRWFPSHRKELGEPECLELLAEHHVGRVAYCDDLGPVVLSVNYAVDQGTILIQTSPHSTLASRLRTAPASFEIDEFDQYTQTGWSVLVRGSAAYVDRPTCLQTKTARTHGRRASARCTSESPRTTSRAADSCPPDPNPAQTSGGPGDGRQVPNHRGLPDRASDSMAGPHRRFPSSSST
jgi:nitroimidazol reductase NimA-like FMN-containing flavoprotein (pyridoxamine 5'-phosphate oxidase superfamily)